MTNTAGGGTKTNEGKEVTRWNATHYGMRSPGPVVPGIWERHTMAVEEALGIFCEEEEHSYRASERGRTPAPTRCRGNSVGDQPLIPHRGEGGH